MEVLNVFNRLKQDIIILQFYNIEKDMNKTFKFLLDSIIMQALQKRFIDNEFFKFGRQPKQLPLD